MKNIQTLCALILVLFLCMVSHWGMACADGPGEDEYYYYNLLKQTNIADESYYPFLRNDMYTFYGSDDPTYFGNLQLWGTLLTDWDTAQIRSALYAPFDFEFEKVFDNRTSPLETASKKYMEFARSCGQAYNYRTDYSWYYDRIQDAEQPDHTALIEKAFTLYNAEENTQLKSRYAYQLMRAFHYAKEYGEAVRFFNNKVRDKVEKNEIYYYLLDQVAGCYYSLEEYEQAAYYFLKVFQYSKDRKRSAFISYRFCNNHNAEGKSLFNGEEDELMYILMKSLRDFSDNQEELRRLNEEEPGSKKVELLFMRSLNDVERICLPKHIGMGATKTPNLSAEVVENARFLHEISSSLSDLKILENRSFWQLSTSYLSFLLGNTKIAAIELDNIEGNEFADQRAILKEIYHVFEWNTMSEKEESYVAELLNMDQLKQRERWYGEDWKDLVMDQVSHLYYREGKLAQAFLVHNTIENLRGIEHLALIDDLWAFVEKPNKNLFEEKILAGAMIHNSAMKPITALKKIKANYYLQEGDPQSALALYSELHKEQIRKEEFVSNRVFSNNVLEHFDTLEQAVMVDSVFLADVFSFIPKSFDKMKLAQILIKLDSLGKDEARWKRKLAHYLLGNYYFNVSNTGYFRETLSHHPSNCCHYNYYPYRNSSFKNAQELLEAGEGQNLSDISYFDWSYRELSKKSINHYLRVLELSADDELNARTLYMMAKGELNLYYNEAFPEDAREYWYGDYEGGLEGQAADYKTSFQQLKENYSHTQFNQMILKECSFYRYYCSL